MLLLRSLKPGQFRAGKQHRTYSVGQVPTRGALTIQFTLQFTSVGFIHQSGRASRVGDGGSKEDVTGHGAYGLEVQLPSMLVVPRIRGEYVVGAVQPLAVLSSTS